MSVQRVSVLVPSFKRPAMLARCLEGLSAQSRSPNEVIVVWQGDDTPTRDELLAIRDRLKFELRILHLERPGIVPAENLALSEAQGEIVFLIDDDAVPPPDWIDGHLRHYLDPKVGAVGGPANNFRPDGTPFPKRTAEKIGTLAWFGKAEGNMYDHPEEWKTRRPLEVVHLVGYNFSFRRSALAKFDEGLKPYWQQFELEACLQVREAGFRVLFDFAIRVDHHPTNIAYDGSRDSHHELRNYNPAFNQAYVLSKHSRGVLRPIRLGYLLGVGNIAAPGLVGFMVAVARFRKPRREATIFARCLVAKVHGWRRGKSALTSSPAGPGSAPS